MYIVGFITVLAEHGKKSPSMVSRQRIYILYIEICVSL